MIVKLSRDPGTPIKYPSWHSFVEQSRDPGTKTTVTIINYSVISQNILADLKGPSFNCTLLTAYLYLLYPIATLSKSWYLS